MEIKALEGLLMINGTDVWKEYGVFLTEDKEDERSNWDELLKPLTMKSYTEVDFRERDGVKLPGVLPSPKFEARDFTLYFAMLADDPEQFHARRQSFLRLLTSGWLELQVSGLNRHLKVYYKECSEYRQLTDPNGSGEVCANFKVKFREPEPAV